MHPGLEPDSRGRKHVIQREEEEKLVLLVEAMRTMKIAVYHSTLFHIADMAIKGTVFQKRFKHGQVLRKWFWHFS